jgi:hypothetical protein
LLTQREADDLYLQHAPISGQGAEASSHFEPRAKESFEIVAKIAYPNDGRIGIPNAGPVDCAMVAEAPVLPAGYVSSAHRIADRQLILPGYRMADSLRIDWSRSREASVERIGRTQS